MASVARDLGVHDSVVGLWVRKARIDAGKGPPGALTTAEREELTKLRKQVRVLEMERTILKNSRGPQRPTWSTRNSRCAIVAPPGG